MRPVLILLVILFAALAEAQPGGPAALAPPVSAAPSSEAPPSSEARAPEPGDDVTAEQAVAAYRAAKDAVQAPTVVGIAAALSASIWVVVGALRRFGGRLGERQDVRRFIAVAVLLAGGAAGVMPGMAWPHALVVALAPVLAMGIHEFVKKPSGGLRA